MNPRNRTQGWFGVFFLLAPTLLYADGFVLNNPYPARESKEDIYYTSFSEQPKTLDPAKSYSSNEYIFIAQIYEPVLQYDYLTRPYTLAPLTATQLPEVRYYHKSGQLLDNPAPGEVFRSVYTIHIQPGIYFQPHPAFAQDQQGHYLYHHMTAGYLDAHGIKQLSDFEHTGTRELKSEDYLYEIKRLADPAINSPIYGLMSTYIEGFQAFAKTLPSERTASQSLDLRRYPLSGIQKIDDYTFEITIKGRYTQFLFWLAMPFFSPVPWEADRFYAQPDMEDKNLGFGWYPVGTGPFMLSENNPNSRMILDKNPNYRAEFYPKAGTLEDEQEGYLHHRGERLPLIEKAVYTLEKEAIPRWTKFLQGYYDLSGVSADSFDQAIQITPSGEATLTPEMQSKGIRLTQMTDPSIYYSGFNMLDPIVGGQSARARKLRQAISIAVNYDENIAIFYNGRGQAAQGPIPPGIFGYQAGKEGINPYVYKWDGQRSKRRSIDEAKQLMQEAGYPGGRDPKTGQPLILHYDVPTSGAPDEKARLNWMRKQFAQIGISLNIRATQYNRFQTKMRNGNAQIFNWGWHADYPDPENFLFLLYGKNSKVHHGGENAANYQNAEYDRLFDLMKNRANDAKREKIIHQMISILQRDAPWIWGINSQSLVLSQQWVSPTKPNTISQNTLKYMNIDVELRNRLRSQWNQPILWPVLLFFGFISILLLPFVFAYYHHQKRRVRRIQG